MNNGNEMTDSQLLIYENQEGNIRVDIRLEDELLGLNQKPMGDLIGKETSAIAVNDGTKVYYAHLQKGMIA